VIPADLVVAPRIAAFLDYTATKAGVIEIPPGSNRGPEIDAWAREFGSPLGSYWCALAVGHCRKRCGLWVPTRDVGSCDEWVKQAIAAGLWLDRAAAPPPGSAVVYTNGAVIRSGRYAGQLDAVHIGTVLRWTPVTMAWEGNTTLGKYDRNGFVLALKKVDRARVMGFILPGLVDPATAKANALPSAAPTAAPTTRKVA